MKKSVGSSKRETGKYQGAARMFGSALQGIRSTPKINRGMNLQERNFEIEGYSAGIKASSELQSTKTYPIMTVPKTSTPVTNRSSRSNPSEKWNRGLSSIRSALSVEPSSTSAFFPRTNESCGSNQSEKWNQELPNILSELSIKPSSSLTFSPVTNESFGLNQSKMLSVGFSSTSLSFESSSSPSASSGYESASPEVSLQEFEKDKSGLPMQLYDQAITTEPSVTKNSMEILQQVRQSDKENFCSKSENVEGKLTTQKSNTIASTKPSRTANTYKQVSNLKYIDRKGNDKKQSTEYKYEWNAENTTSTKWDTFFSTQSKSQLQNCSTQRYSGTNLNKGPKKFHLSSTALQTEPSVASLFTFTEESFIDAHCHLDFFLEKVNYGGTFADYRRDFASEFPHSYSGCIAVFCNPYSFRKVFLWKKYIDEESVWASFGCHPKSAASYNDSVEHDLCKALEHPKVRALGEIGLDYSERSFCPKPMQKEVFRRQIKIALTKNLPLVIHCRDAYDDCLETLKELVPRGYPIHLHCFTSVWSIAQQYLSEFPNLCIGITNLVTFSSATEVQEVAKKIPLDRLLLETDAPYFVPTSLSKKSKCSNPGMAIFVAAKVAFLKSIPLKEVLLQTRRNTSRTYKI